MRRIDLLITSIRKSTENQDFSENSGIGDDEFLQYLNNAQDALYNIIQSLFNDQFQAEAIIDVVAGQESYDLPMDCFLGSRIEMLEYSRTGLARDYYQLKKGHKQERLNGTNGNPSFYIRRGDKILIQPIPEATGSLRVLYQKRIPTLDTRRGVVDTVTTSGNSITSLILDNTQLIDSTSLNSQNKITIVDRSGAVKMRNIDIDMVSESTGVVSITSGFLFEDGESITSGDYVLTGKYASTHSFLPDICEQYLIEYGNLRTLIRDSSVDSADLAQLVLKFENELKTAFGESDGDVKRVPIIDTQFIGYSDRDWS